MARIDLGLVKGMDGRTLSLNGIQPDANGNLVVGAADVGAAPDGYGLGKQAGATIGPGNIDTTLLNGTYYYYDNAFNALIPNISSGMGILDVSSDTRFIRQTFHSHLGGYIARRHTLPDSVEWESWEYVNPPMIPGIEYRTTERHHGNPVYVKLISAGALPNNSVKTVPVVEDVATVQYLVYVSGVDRETGQILPSGAFGGDSTRQVMVGGNKHGITIVTNFDASYASNVYMTVKYVKTTDQGG